MEFVDYLSIRDRMHLISLSTEIMSKSSMVNSMYTDICETLGCYVPKLEICMFGLMKPCGDGNVIARPGSYFAPNLIRIGMIDIYVAAYEHGMLLNNHDMDIMFKAEVAHTLIHEISHSMQNTFVDPIMVSAMEWANEQNVWCNLYPILAPMLKKKYKIKLYEETVDETCGRVFSYNYRMMDSFNSVINFLIHHAVEEGFAPSEGEVFRVINNAADISIFITANGVKLPNEYTDIKKNGVVNYEVADYIRNFISNIPLSFEYDFTMSTSVDQTKIQILVKASTSEYEPLYRSGSPDWE